MNRFTLSSGAKLPYHYTYSLTGSPRVTQAVLIVHGTRRIAKDHFEAVLKPAKQLRVESHTALIAPRFQAKEDRPASDEAYWTNEGATSWMDGGDAVSPTGLSSFDVADEILRILSDKVRFPNLTRITVVGHSAGGQFVQRYAAGSRAPSALRGIPVEFVVSSPSSYLYLDKQRPVGTNSCPTYDDYKYGMANRNRYMSAVTDQRIITQYTTRKVTYLPGGADDKQDGSLDVTCSARVQGENRLERAKNFFSIIKRKYPSAPHNLVEVPGVGHDTPGMLGSAHSKTVIFGGGNIKSSGPTGS